LQQTPEKAGNAEDPDKKSRLERLIESKAEVPLPPVSARYLLGWLSDLGWAQSNGMAATPLSACEMKAWCELAEIELEAWEFEALRSASRAYCAQSALKDAFPPWQQEKDGNKPKTSIAGKFKTLANMLNRKN